MELLDFFFFAFYFILSFFFPNIKSAEEVADLVFTRKGRTGQGPFSALQTHLDTVNWRLLQGFPKDVCLCWFCFSGKFHIPPIHL